MRKDKRTGSNQFVCGSIHAISNRLLLCLQMMIYIFKMVVIFGCNRGENF